VPITGSEHSFSHHIVTYIVSHSRLPYTKNFRLSLHDDDIDDDYDYDDDDDNNNNNNLS